MKKKVLFICTHNSARSQMAEGFLNTFYGEKYEGYSAGLQPSPINPYAIMAMKDIGIDISGQHSKSIENFREENFDFVVTVCDKARESCPFFPGKKVLHKRFDDPSSFEGSQDEILTKLRCVRDEIKDWIRQTFGDNH